MTTSLSLGRAADTSVATHPVDGKPVTDTPITYERANFGHEEGRLWRYVETELAQQLERDKRKAEAQLAVAIKCLDFILSETYSSRIYDPLNEALQEIKAIGRV